METSGLFTSELSHTAGVVATKIIEKGEFIQIFSTLHFYPSKEKLSLEEFKDHRSLVHVLGAPREKERKKGRGRRKGKKQLVEESYFEDRYARMSGPAAQMNTAHQECVNVENLTGQARRSFIVRKKAIIITYKPFSNHDWGVYRAKRTIGVGEQLTLWYGHDEICNDGSFVCPSCTRRG
tara:strand:+ start:520 stop:1059 length:540 start_codon:yes stop_codon:yes gene_type:complete